jgi:aminomethyltransferase
MSAPTAAGSTEVLGKTPLHAWHLRNGARMGGFAGYDMPIRYEAGTIAEHNHTRSHAGLFDVSHMGVAVLHADSGSFADVAAALELFVPCDVDALAAQRQRYTQLLNQQGGIIDDLMILRTGVDSDDPNTLTIVANAGRKTIVFSHLSDHLPDGVHLRVYENRGLLALQGPEAETVLCSVSPHAAVIDEMIFLDVRHVTIAECDVVLSRSGYSGEDGFEISCAPDDAENIANALLHHEAVQPAGLGARDTLRLEAGLCLYGNDIDESTSPIEAGLAWSIQRRRRAEGGFAGADRVQAELSSGAGRALVGLMPEGRAPVRDHTDLFADAACTQPIGIVTSGGFGPTLGHPISMGYVDPAHAEPGAKVYAQVRANVVALDVINMPAVPTKFRRTKPSN